MEWQVVKLESVGSQTHAAVNKQLIHRNEISRERERAECMPEVIEIERIGLYICNEAASNLEVASY